MFITVTAWNNGDFNASGAGYGIRVSKADRGSRTGQILSSKLAEDPNSRFETKIQTRLRLLSGTLESATG